MYSPKRTFDLMLFSKKEFIIIEAKAQQKFKTHEIDRIKEDCESIQLLFKRANQDISVKFICLVSSICYEKSTILKKINNINNSSGVIQWKDLFIAFEDDMFDKADKVYGI